MATPTRRGRRRCLKPRHDLLDHGFQPIEIQAARSARPHLSPTNHIQNFIPAAIDELVDLLSLLAASLRNALLDLPSHLGSPVLELFPPALRFTLLILHVLPEEIDLEALDPILQDNHCILSRIQDEKDE